MSRTREPAAVCAALGRISYTSDMSARASPGTASQTCDRCMATSPRFQSPTAGLAGSVTDRSSFVTRPTVSPSASLAWSHMSISIPAANRAPLGRRSWHARARLDGVSPLRHTVASTVYRQAQGPPDGASSGRVGLLLLDGPASGPAGASTEVPVLRGNRPGARQAGPRPCPAPDVAEAFG